MSNHLHNDDMRNIIIKAYIEWTSIPNLYEYIDDEIIDFGDELCIIEQMITEHGGLIE